MESELIWNLSPTEPGYCEFATSLHNNSTPESVALMQVLLPLDWREQRVPKSLGVVTVPFV